MFDSKDLRWAYIITERASIHGNSKRHPRIVTLLELHASAVFSVGFNALCVQTFMFCDSRHCVLIFVFSHKSHFSLFYGLTLYSFYLFILCHCFLFSSPGIKSYNIHTKIILITFMICCSVNIVFDILFPSVLNDLVIFFKILFKHNSDYR